MRFDKPRLASRSALEDIVLNVVWPQVEQILLMVWQFRKEMMPIGCSQVRQAIKQSPGQFDLEVRV